MNAFELAGIEYAFPQFFLGPVDLSICAGELVGIVGPNGSGKTTLMDVIAGRRQPDSGEARVLGRRPKTGDVEFYGNLGFAPDDVEETIPELSAEELWDLHAAIRRTSRAERDALVASAMRLAERLDFAPPARPIGEYSHGMKKKTQLVAALMHEPKALILDEPTNGLDPLTAYEFGSALLELTFNGTATLVATHDLAWAQRFCDRVLVLRAGRVVASGLTAELLPRADTSALLEQFVRLVSAPTMSVEIEI